MFSVSSREDQNKNYLNMINGRGLDYRQLYGK